MDKGKQNMTLRKTFLLGNAASLGAKGVSILVGLASVPIGLHYFGPVRYGIWMVVTSMLAYLSLSQLGIGTAAQTLIAKTVEPSHQRAILRRSLSLLTLSSLIFVSGFLLLAHYLPGWIGILGEVPSSFQYEATRAVLTIGVLFLLGLPMIGFSAAFTGVQEMYWKQFYGALTAVARLGALIATVLLRGSLVTLALLTGLGSVAVGMLSGIHFLLTHPDIRPQLEGQVAGAPSVRLILTTGARFFAISIAGMIIWNTDNWVISHFLGFGEVTPYAVTFRLFAVGFSLFTMVNWVLWPMYGRAAGTDQWVWVQRTYVRATSLLPVVGGLLWIGGIAFAREIISLWVGPSAYGGGLTVMALGGFGYCLSLNICHSTVLSGLNAIRNVVAITVLEAALNISISLILIGLLGIGGVALGTFVAALPAVFLLPLDVARQTGGKIRFRLKPIAIHATTVLFPALIAMYLLGAYGPSGWSGTLMRVTVMMLYLGFSWYVSPVVLRRFIGDKSRELLVRLKGSIMVGL